MVTAGKFRAVHDRQVDTTVAHWHRIQTQSPKLNPPKTALQTTLPLMSTKTVEKDARTTDLLQTRNNFPRLKFIPGGIAICFVWLLSFKLYNSRLVGINRWTLPASDPLSESSYNHLTTHCASIPPISYSEFLLRQASLAKTLHALGADAYIAEPGANTQFFANFSRVQWSLSERPLLLIVTPIVSGLVDEEVRAQITLLTPKFETTRAKLLPIPNLDGLVNYVEWAEETDPYAAALSTFQATTPQAGRVGTQKIFVDNSIRKFIVDGLYHASQSETKLRSQFSRLQFDNQSLDNVDPAHHHGRKPLQISSAPLEVTQMRERKSEAELEILQCVNEATLLAIRDVHKKLVPGIRESYARGMMSAALGAAGLKDGGCLTLFGENAALPHGSGTDRMLASTDFALFDCTASLHGYYSDVTRTVSLDAHVPPAQLKTWFLVHAAQSVALRTAHNGTRTADVDGAARALLRQAHKAQYFTHRLGHGIGLEVHEAPYLRGGSADIIQTGHTFSNEPGIYIEGEYGVRLEDCFYINERGTATYLTAGVGGQSKKPWLP